MAGMFDCEGRVENNDYQDMFFRGALYSNYKFCFLLLANGYIHIYIYIYIYIHNTWEHLNKYSNFNSSTTYKTNRKLANYYLRIQLDMSLISGRDGGYAG
jgi:hypothetical protein